MMNDQKVTYKNVDADYFQKRGLKRHAKVLHLWALGVGAVISGDFFGWNFGLASGGFGGMLVAMLVVTAMYIGLCFSIAEMSPALPHAGGAYSFARTAMGPLAGYVTGLAENMEYILTPAVIVVGIGSYCAAIFETPPGMLPVWWFLAYVAFVGLNIWGAQISFRFSILITCIALCILLVFYVGATPHLAFANLFEKTPDGKWLWFPSGARGILASFPFAIWFYLGIEELPLAAEESVDPKRDMPKGILWGLLTLIIFSFLTLFFNSAIPPGASALGTSQEPLFDGFKTIFGQGLGTKALALCAVAGLVASFHTIIFAYGRQIYSLSRAGYFPPFFSLTHSTRKTPHLALITGAVMGYVVALCIHYFGAKHAIGAVLLNMAVFGAVISYMLQMLSYILLRLKFPAMERPYVSPFGIPGAALAFSIAAATLVGLFVSDPIYVKVVWASALWFGLGVVYFLLIGRHQLVEAPEEAFAKNLR